jgi:hypothetical protein
VSNTHCIVLLKHALFSEIIQHTFEKFAEFQTHISNFLERLCQKNKNQFGHSRILSLKYDMSIFVFDDGFGNLVGESGKESVIIEMEVDFEAYPLDYIINHAINILT